MSCRGASRGGYAGPLLRRERHRAAAADRMGLVPGEGGLPCRMPAALSPIPARLVLLRPRNPENLGAVARAMKNFGLADWAVVELGTHDFASARRVAVHAEDVLDRPRLVRTLDEAVADCAWVVGTSSRRVRGARRLPPDEVAREAWERAA